MPKAPKDKVFMPILSCEKCECRSTEPDYTADSFERPEKWFCNHPETVPPKRLIASYVEWHDKVAVPQWCPWRGKL